MMHGHGKSDEAIVAVKPANKVERSAAELVERRAEAKGKGRQRSRAGLSTGSSVLSSLAHLRQADLPWMPEVGAVCGKAARTDLCGGRGVILVPTATRDIGRMSDVIAKPIDPCP